MTLPATNHNHGCSHLPLSGVEIEFRRKLGAQYRELIGYDPFEDDPSITSLEVAKTLREYRVAAGIPLASPDFGQSPQPPAWSMIAYGGERDGYDLDPLEFNYSTSSLQAIERAKFEAAWQGRTHVKVRAASGKILFDGEVQ